MPKTDPKPTNRVARRAEARQKRIDRAMNRRKYFELIVSGYSREQVAARLGVSISTVRREVDRVVAARPCEAPERFVGLQVARLHKALRVVDCALEDGELDAVGPLMKVVAELDRYHGIEARLADAARAAVALPPPSPAPLALTHEAADRCKKTHLAP